MGSCQAKKYSARNFFTKTDQVIPPNIQILEQICQRQRITNLNEFINNKQIKDQLDNYQKEKFKKHAEEEWIQNENIQLIQDNQKVYDEVREFDYKYFIKKSDNIYQLNNDKLLEYPKPDHLQRYIVFGLQDSGKTTFINNLINVFHGIKYFHRFRIVAEYRKGHYDEGVLRYRTFKKDDQGKIHLLEIIDTPSYLQLEDYIEGALFTLKIAQFLHTQDIQEVNMILFVKKYQNKQKAIELDKYHSYVLNQIKRLFGENYLYYLRFILTYSTEIEKLTPATQTSSQFLYLTNQVNNTSLKFTDQTIDFRKILSKYDYDWYKQMEIVYNTLMSDDKSNKRIKAISEADYLIFKNLDSAKIDLGRRIYNMLVDVFVNSHNYKSALMIHQQFTNNQQLDGKSFLKYQLDYAEVNGQKEKFTNYIISIKTLEEFLDLQAVDLPQDQQNQIWNSLDQPQNFQNFNEPAQDVVPRTIFYESFKLERSNSLFSRKILSIKFEKLLEQLLIQYQSNMKIIIELINEYLEVNNKIEESSAIQSNIKNFSDVLKKYIVMISSHYVAQKDQFKEISNQLEIYQQTKEPFIPK